MLSSIDVAVLVREVNLRFHEAKCLQVLLNRPRIRSFAFVSSTADRGQRPLRERVLLLRELDRLRAEGLVNEDFVEVNDLRGVLQLRTVEELIARADHNLDLCFVYFILLRSLERHASSSSSKAGEALQKVLSADANDTTETLFGQGASLGSRGGGGDLEYDRQMRSPRSPRLPAASSAQRSTGFQHRVERLWMRLRLIRNAVVEEPIDEGGEGGGDGERAVAAAATAGVGIENDSPRLATVNEDFVSTAEDAAMKIEEEAWQYLNDGIGSIEIVM